MSIDNDLSVKQQELTETLSQDPHFVSLEPEKVGESWIFAVYTNEKKLREPTYYKGVPVVFKKRKLSKRFISEF